jgi:hypothetical protein
MTIHLHASFLIYLLIHIRHAWGCVWGLSFPLVLGVSHCICSQLLNPMEIHIFCLFMVGKGRPCMILCEMILWPLWKMWDFMCCKNKPMSFCPCPIIFALSSWHCAINQWCLHINRHCQHWPHSSYLVLHATFFHGVVARIIVWAKDNLYVISSWRTWTFIHWHLCDSWVLLNWEGGQGDVCDAQSSKLNNLWLGRKW